MQACILRRLKGIDTTSIYHLGRTWIDQLIPKEVRDNELNFNFYDIQANYGQKLSNGDELEFNFMHTRDLV